MEEDGIVVVSIIPYAPRTEASIEYEPCWPGKSFSPYCAEPEFCKHLRSPGNLFHQPVFVNT
jgi:hypothetical protein